MEKEKEKGKKTTKKKTVKKETKKTTKKSAKKQTKKEIIKKIVEETDVSGISERVKKELEEGMKNKGGRPKKYETVEEVEEIIESYFRSCMKPVLNARHEPIKDPISGDYVYEQIRPFTMSGLAYELDMSRQSLLNYSKDEKFFDTIERARRRVERYAEESLFEKERCNGSKFSLANNFGWSEKNETKISAEKLEEIL